MPLLSALLTSLLLPLLSASAVELSAAVADDPCPVPVGVGNHRDTVQWSVPVVVWLANMTLMCVGMVGFVSRRGG